MSEQPQNDAIEILKDALERQNFAPFEQPKRCDEAELDEAEAAVGYRLPEDFRWFSGTHGGGSFKGRGGRRITLEDGATADLDRIGGEDFLPHARFHTYGAPNFPPGLIRCADTIMGDVYFLRLDPPYNGSVWHWGYSEGRDPHTDLIRAADSFSDLAASLVPVTPEE